MKFIDLAILITGVLTLCSCSIKGRNEDAVISKPDVAISFQNSLQQHFYDEARQCVLGDIRKAELLKNSFYSSINYAQTKQAYIYQDPVLTQELEKCLRKSDLETGNSLYLEYVPSPRICAQIAKAFLIKKDYQKSAFWIRRVYNQLGRMRGSELAGLVFIEDPKTMDTGAALLSEAAKLGSQSASMRLNELAFGN
ncbi:MAG: hypothetical protein MR571_04855 [Succinatimonas sp.]|nr:hypothetical protein [Succinatimonas sp.]